MDHLIIFGAKYLIIVPVLALVWLAARQTKKNRVHLGMITLFAFLIAGVLDKIGGWLFYDTRPFVSQNIVPLIKHSADNGFPSEHTLLAATIAAIVYFYDKTLAAYLGVVALLIGATRVAAHVHSTIDIIGSLAMAIIASYAARHVATHWVSKNGQSQTKD